MPLTDSVCRNAKPKEKQYKLTDSAGMPNGGRYWLMKYYFGGKEKLLALGTYPEVSLAAAREKSGLPPVARTLSIGMIRLSEVINGTTAFYG
jgi:hypothetical protein